jgi:hypothetical protein
MMMMMIQYLGQQLDYGQGPSRGQDPYRRYVCLSFHPFFLQSHLSWRKSRQETNGDNSNNNNNNRECPKKQQQWDALENKQTRVTTRQASRQRAPTSDASSLFSVRSDIVPIFIFLEVTETFFESRSIRQQQKGEGQVSFSFSFKLFSYNSFFFFPLEFLGIFILFFPVAKFESSRKRDVKGEPAQSAAIFGHQLKRRHVPPFFVLSLNISFLSNFNFNDGS